jgi:hypothetical protein
MVVSYTTYRDYFAKPIEVLQQWKYGY